MMSSSSLFAKRTARAATRTAAGKSPITYRRRTAVVRGCSSWDRGRRPAYWSEEWKKLGLGAELVDNGVAFPRNLFFVQLGFGVDQHGEDDATKAAVRAVRNAVEFNSIPGVISHLPGGRSEMLVHVKLGVPPVPATESDDDQGRPQLPLPVDALEVAKVFPYGKLLPFEVCVGGLAFHTGRVVEELGDSDDVGVCVAACVSIGYNDDSDDKTTRHRTYNTKDGY